MVVEVTVVSNEFTTIPVNLLETGRQTMNLSFIDVM